MEVPIETKTESESVPGNPINIFQSTLDPNSRPFTPAASVKTVADVEDASTELSLSLTSTHDSSLSTALSSSLSKPEDDPLPDDPKLLLPELLDISQDEPSESRVKGLPGQDLKVSVSLPSLADNILPPPIFPFATHWSGKSRPPLLPTPKHFPPFGPRQSEPETEQEPPLLSPWSPATSGLSSGLSSQESLAVRKAGMVRRFSVGRTPLTPGNIGQDSEKKSYSEVSKLALPGEEKEEQEENWQPLGLSWMPPSLTDSHPAPDEYLVSKVIGTKLPAVKLQNCHTDLLFFLFYSFHGDLQQLLAAGLLFDRGWRFHSKFLVRLGSLREA